jgi:4-amino-4-deoxy-L-arabinose transferase-like glycosyltransferase
MGKQLSRTRLYCLFAFSILVVAAIVFVAAPMVKAVYPYVQLNVFPDHYNLLASNLAEGVGYRYYAETAPTMLRTPAYPLLLSGIFMAFGKGIVVVKIVNVIFALLIAFISAKISLLLFRDRIVAILAAVGVLLHPAIVMAETRGGPEVFLTLAITLYCWMLLKALDSDRKRHYFYAGLILGVSALIKSTTILFPLIWLPLLMWMKRKEDAPRQRMLRGVVMFVGMILVLTPWMVRNYTISGRLVPTMTIGGMSISQGMEIVKNVDFDNLLAGDNYVGRGMNSAAREGVRKAREMGLEFEGDYFIFFNNVQDEIMFNNMLLKQAIGEYFSSPRLFIKSLFVNAFNFWFAGVTKLTTGISVIIQLPLIILTLLGLYGLRQKKRLVVVLPLAIFMFYYVALHLPILAVARHSIPLVPMMMVIAVLPLGRLGERLLLSRN